MKIQILHLDDGLHEFDYELNPVSLINIPKDIFTNDIHLYVSLNKFGKNINCEVQLSTTINFVCDRCLASCRREIKENFKLLFHLGKTDLKAEEDDVFLLSPDQFDVDLTPSIEEYLLLSVPMKMVCREDCKGLCPVCGVDLNFESCTCEQKTIDPRWEKLQGLLK